MKNADLFKQIFNIYATELWSMPEAEFLEWLNKNAVPATPIPEGATNGDVLKALFPKKEWLKAMAVCERDKDIKGWWNAPYKRGETNE